MKIQSSSYINTPWCLSDFCTQRQTDFLPRLTTLQHAQSATVYESSQFSRKCTQERNHRSKQILQHYRPRLDVRYKPWIRVVQAYHNHHRVISETLLDVHNLLYTGHNGNLVCTWSSWPRITKWLLHQREFDEPITTQMACHSNNLWPQLPSRNETKWSVEMRVPNSYAGDKEENWVLITAEYNFVLCESVRTY